MKCKIYWVFIGQQFIYHDEKEILPTDWPNLKLNGNLMNIWNWIYSVDGKKRECWDEQNKFMFLTALSTKTQIGTFFSLCGVPTKGNVFGKFSNTPLSSLEKVHISNRSPKNQENSPFPWGIKVVAIRRYFGKEIHLFALEDSAGKTLPGEKLGQRLKKRRKLFIVLFFQLDLLHKTLLVP